MNVCILREVGSGIRRKAAAEIEVKMGKGFEEKRWVCG